MTTKTRDAVRGPSEPTAMARRSVRCFGFLVAAGLFLLSSGPGAAQDIAFAVADGPYQDQAVLLRLDLASGSTSPVGTIGYATTHLAHTSSGALYGVDSRDGQLLLIDIGTGAGIPIGPLGIDLVDARGLAFDSTDRLWMSAVDDAHVSALFEIDVTSGAATWIAEIAPEYGGSLASFGETMYVAGLSLGILDTSSGHVTPIAASDFGIWGTRALDFDSSGTLRGLMLCLPCWGPMDSLVVKTIDPVTGMLEDHGLGLPHGIWGLAIFDGGIFFDGFELGNTDMWSATQGSQRAIASARSCILTGLAT